MRGVATCHSPLFTLNSQDGTIRCATRAGVILNTDLAPPGGFELFDNAPSVWHRRTTSGEPTAWQERRRPVATSTHTKRKLSVGKVAGLRRLADERGIFLITAMHPRNSLRVMLNPADPNSVPAEKLTEI